MRQVRRELRPLSSQGFNKQKAWSTDRGPGLVPYETTQAFKCRGQGVAGSLYRTRYLPFSERHTLCSGWKSRVVECCNENSSGHVRVCFRASNNERLHPTPRIPLFYLSALSTSAYGSSQKRVAHRPALTGCPVAWIQLRSRMQFSKIVYAIRKYTVSNIHMLSYARMIAKYA